MITIDLLKGRGFTTTNITQNVTALIIAATVPAVLAIVMIFFLVHLKITSAIQKKRIANYQTRIEQSSQILAFRRNFENETGTINNCLSDVAVSINKYLQWSQVIESVVNNIPGTMILTKLEAQQKPLKIKNASDENSKKTTTLNAVVRTLTITVNGDWGIDYDKDVQKFKNMLNSSPNIGPYLSKIKISRKSQELDQKETSSYEIECTFKPLI
ncbi:MAG: hypothetical protein A2Y10_09690 [Planctomycetes bacterium GWF2_41_51]|nr:MAG: hypothetical protein A2Y10_09690 [Planctomycetes bacterium GWF2_41_51]HBG28255.1 hypothetical protein [Phycisphaerales bacterium]